MFLASSEFYYKLRTKATANGKKIRFHENQASEPRAGSIKHQTNIAIIIYVYIPRHNSLDTIRMAQA